MGDFFEFLRTSFFHVAPILVAGAIAIAIIAERARALFFVYPIRDTQSFFDRIRELVLAGKVAEGIALCDRYATKPSAQVVKQALLRAHQPDELIQHGLQIAVGDASATIQKRTTFLATIANVATLLGLLGTIAGLIHSFQAVGHADAQQKAALLAQGISQAMNATMLGLGVAIPCMVAFSFLMNRTNRLVGELDGAAIRSIDILKQRYFLAEIEASRGASTGSADSTDSEEAHATSANGSGKSAKPSQLRRVA